MPIVKLLTSRLVLILAYLLLPSILLAQDSTNLLRCGGFLPRDYTEWDFEVYGRGSAAATRDWSEDGVYCVNVTAPGDSGWEVHLMQDLPRLTEGHEYEIAYLVEANQPRTMYSVIGGNTEPYETQFIFKDTLFQKKWIRHTFIPQASLSNMRLAFDMGDMTGEVCFDSVSLHKTGFIIPDTVPPYFYNFLSDEVWTGDTIYLSVGEEYSPESYEVRVYDSREGFLGHATITVKGDSLDSEVPGIYELLYTGSDESGNTCSAIRTLSVSEPGAGTREKIASNQIGFTPSSVKRLTVRDTGSGLSYLMNADNNQRIDTMHLTATSFVYHELSEDTFATVDISRISEEGNYYIIMKDYGFTYPFSIKDDLYTEPFKAAMKAFYYQRSSYAKGVPFSEEFTIPAGHFQDTACVYHESTDKTGTLFSMGGWYDAGDYGKYVVSAGITVNTLLSFHEMYPDYVTDGFLNIPEKRNDKSDLLDEVGYELDWLKTMQDEDGGVFHKITALEFAPMAYPDYAEDPRYVFKKSTSATLNFASVMAQASRVYAESGFSSEADTLKEAAIRAWQWAEQNPNTIFFNPPGVPTGAYSDLDFEDEFFNAAVQLYISTREPAYLETINEYINSGAHSFPASWSNVAPLGFFSLSHHRTDEELAVRSDSIITAHAQEALETAREDRVFGIPMKEEHFIWGSNSILLNFGILFAYAYRVTSESEYLEKINNILDYIYGNNPMNKSFQTRFGSNPPRYPHHRLSRSGNPLPGFLVGGPNKDKEDEQYVPYYYDSPAKCYTDYRGSYASNEVAINWNAPLAFLLGFAINVDPGDVSIHHDKGTAQSLTTARKDVLRLRIHNMTYVIPFDNFKGTHQRLEIFNLQGRSIFSKSISQGMSLSAGNLPAGTYVVRIKSPGWSRATRINVMR